MIAIFRYVDVAVTVYSQALRLAELAVCVASAPPFEKEFARCIEDLDPVISSI